MLHTTVDALAEARRTGAALAADVRGASAASIGRAFDIEIAPAAAHVAGA